MAITMRYGSSLVDLGSVSSVPFQKGVNMLDRPGGFARLSWGGWGGMLTFAELVDVTHALGLRAHAIHATPMYFDTIFPSIYIYIF